MAILNLASVRLCTESEGPGKRFAIWVQGCEKRCPGCCNIHMQEKKKNVIVDAQDVIKLIQKSVDDNGIEGVSFIGGEPMLQAEGLGEIAKWAHSIGLTVLVFTGYLYSDLQRMNNPIVNELLEHVDLLVDGPFNQEEYDYERDWIGSKNQQLHFLTEAYQPGIEFASREHKVEILVSEKEVMVNGWPY